MLPGYLKGTQTAKLENKANWGSVAYENDPLVMFPRLETYRHGLNPYGLCDIGHQGLPHNKEYGGVIGNRIRDLHPRFGRFMQRDPGPGRHSSRIGRNGYRNQYIDGMNLYQYVKSNPINYRDPMGLYVVRTVYDNGRSVRMYYRKATWWERNWKGSPDWIYDYTEYIDAPWEKWGKHRRGLGFDNCKFIKSWWASKKDCVYVQKWDCKQEEISFIKVPLGHDPDSFVPKLNNLISGVNKYVNLAAVSKALGPLKWVDIAMNLTSIKSTRVWAEHWTNLKGTEYDYYRETGDREEDKFLYSRHDDPILYFSIKNEAAMPSTDGKALRNSIVGALWEAVKKGRR